MRTTAFVFVSTILWAQQAGPTFEVASIKVSNADPGPSGITTGRGRLDAENVTVRRCILGAWRLGPHQLSGGPDWIDTDRYHILAKADRPADDPEIDLMFQALLKERFRLQMHTETKTESALVLEPGRNGPRLVKAEGGEASTSTSHGNAGASMVAKNTTMEAFARILSRETHMPVVDRTGLEGVFDIRLRWSPNEAAAESNPDTPGLSTALQEQLGLRLRSAKVPVQIYVIDHVEKPSEN